MINPEIFFNELSKYNFKSYVGVPDSLLKHFCGYVQDNAKNHIIANNEGTALAIATGQYLKSKIPSVVYLQNSGLGNIINPLISLNDEDVYSLPALILIGWRGEPGVKDEPQHYKQGRITESMLNAIGLNYAIMNHESSSKDIVAKAYKFIKDYKKPYAILIRKNTFSEYLSKKSINDSFYNKFPKRETILKNIISLFDKKSLFITTTGVTSREFFEIRQEFNQSHDNDFLTVGSMGHVLAISHGICSFEKRRKVICVDGDGSILMHLGSLSLNYNLNAKNLIHIMINNGSHDSVGGQPTIANNINFKQLSKSLGYRSYYSSKSIKSLKNIFKKINNNNNGPIFWEIFSYKGFRSNLGRPTISPKINVQDFMKKL